jgi:hypothetical protein
MPATTIMRNDVLLDIATFLARRWSGNNKVIISIAPEKSPATKLDKGQITLPSLAYYLGTDFQRYRQWRVALWYESMRMRHSSKVLSNEHAFGFLLNTVETKRVEILGLQSWEGMESELLFNEGISWMSRQLLNAIYGRYKIAEAFSQYFLTGYVKGELFGGEMEKVQKATEYANELVQEALAGGHSTEWMEQYMPKLIKMLELDPLVSIPVLAPRTRAGASLTQSDLLKHIEKVVRSKKKEKESEEKAQEIYEGNDVAHEFETLVKESKKTENKGYDSLENFGLSVPERMDVDEARLYDLDLIQKVKAAFRSWKTGWKEVHDDSGDELDVEALAEPLPGKPFLADMKLSIKTKVVLLLDHSSSIADVELEYKQATIALCEALSYLGVKFAVYAFSTESRQVRAWVVKPPNIKWSLVCARRLAQIKAVGGTPLAEVYGLLQPALKSFRPDIFVTLTDGEPSDFDAVRTMVQTYRKAGIKMAAIGVGRNLTDAVEIGHNLKYLNYEKTLAVSRLQDMPKKVIGLLRS